MQEEQCRLIIGWKSGRPEWTGNYDYFQAGSRYGGKLTAIQRFSPLDLLPILTAEEVVDGVFRSATLLERLCEADWLCPLPGYEEEPYFTSDEVYRALCRLLQGEKPPRSSSELAPVSGQPEIGNPSSLAGYVGAAKAAEFLDLSPSTLRDYSDRGIIPCYRIGKHRKYSLEKIREKLEKEQRESGPGRFEALRGHLR